MDKGLKVIFWNVRSLYNNIDTIRLEIDKINPDILNVCETWLHMLENHLFVKTLLIFPYQIIILNYMS